MALTHLTAPAQWQTIDFVSDLHLQQTDATWHSFEQYLHSTPADAIFLLGDILELWAGDDALQHPELAFERQLVATLQTVSRNKSLYFMRGNRDFLVGNAFCQAAGLTLLDDPCTLEIPCADATAAPTRILLSHGDALCLDDTAYMQFRAQVRNPAWQQQFLQQPLEQRLQLARQLRQQSSMRKTTLGVEGYADVDATQAAQWLQTHQCSLLLHGHTHRPGEHALPSANPSAPLSRMVLSDWDLSATPPRGQIVRGRIVRGQIAHAQSANAQSANAHVRWQRLDVL